jgi:hypothetical protein
MPVSLYTEDEVQVYTRLLARAYAMIREEPATELARDAMLKEIEKTLGWRGPPPMTARPPKDLGRTDQTTA